MQSWREEVKEYHTKGRNDESSGTVSRIRLRVPKFKQGNIANILGKEYWYEPARRECARSLGLNPLTMGGLGVNKQVCSFDYHDAANYEDVRRSYLDTFNVVSRDESADGYQTLIWENYYVSVEQAYEASLVYLMKFTWYDSALHVMQLVDECVMANTSLLTDFEINCKDISVGEPFFNNIYYSSLRNLAVDLIPKKLAEQILFNDPDYLSKQSIYSHPANKLVVDFDEVRSMRFCLSLSQGEFEFMEGNRFVGKSWKCSADDLNEYILPWIMLISNWSLVLGVYLSARLFGSCAVTVSQ